MAITVYGAFRNATTMSDNTATYATNGATFQISSYSTITFEDGADGSIIDGDNASNESPNDTTQTYSGNAIAWDWTVQVNDGTNNYEIGVLDYDDDGDGSFDYPGGEQAYFLVFFGDIPPLNTTLTIGTITDNGPSIDVDTAVPCFVEGTEIETPNGPVAIETLQVGDKVMTLDNGPQAIRWIGCRELGLRELVLKPRLHPIRIVADALGPGMPSRDLCVSPQHRMFVRSPIVKRMFGVDEALIPAIKLVGIPGIFVDRISQPVTYLHLLLDNHEVLFAEGAPAESLLTGPEAMKSIGEDARQELRDIFPDLDLEHHVPEAARYIPQKGRKVKSMVARMIKNDKDLVAEL
ncbi:Hint domain-containing protein [uncultured Shimia sp.]|uniref:Hint domain-containing protein n=1 Tax=uncultured Shimia sp. TaxID=573152 RepID=UPI0026193556|nr:Hint domain-containing protein [uncultured Shimia sp.]